MGEDVTLGFRQKATLALCIAHPMALLQHPAGSRLPVQCSCGPAPAPSKSGKGGDKKRAPAPAPKARAKGTTSRRQRQRPPRHRAARETAKRRPQRRGPRAKMARAAERRAQLQLHLHQRSLARAVTSRPQARKVVAAMMAPRLRRPR